MIRILPALLLWVVSSTAGFHMKVERTFPTDSSTITSSPSVVQLWFSEPPTLAVSSVRLTGPSGRVALGKVAVGKAEDKPDQSLVADVGATLSPGNYTVNWKTSGLDGHMLTGAFQFTVKSP